MTQTDYALSYNVKELVIETLDSIRRFSTSDQAYDFMDWFNGILNAKNRITMTEICRKMHYESIPAFERIGFNDKIEYFDIQNVGESYGIDRPRIIFPVVKDFSKKAQQMEIEEKAEALRKAVRKVREKKEKEKEKEDKKEKET